MGPLQSRYRLLTRAGIIAQSSAPNAREYNLSPNRERTVRLAITPSTMHANAIEWTLWVFSIAVGGGKKSCCDEAIALGLDDGEVRMARGSFGM